MWVLAEIIFVVLIVAFIFKVTDEGIGDDNL